jgi:hypothetical protein
MKLILNQEKMFKLSITQEGQVTVNLANGKQYTGSLTKEETEQLMFRVSAISEGTILFDPTPWDYVNLHAIDVGTLEAQSLTINELREQLKTRDETIEGHQEVIARLADCESELTKARTEARDLALVVQQQADKLGIITMKTAMKADEAPTVADPPSQDKPAGKSEEEDV